MIVRSLAWALVLALSVPLVAEAGDEDLPRGAVARLGTRRLRHASSVLGVAVSADSKILASATQDEIAVFETGTWKELARIACRPAALALSPDGGLVTDGSSAWSTKNGAVAWTGGAPGRVLAFSADGKLLAVGSDVVSLRDAATGRELRKLVGQEGEIGAVAFSPRGDRIAVGDGEGEIRIRETATGRTLRRLLGHTTVNGLAFSPDGATLASSGDGARLWNAGTGELIRGLECGSSDASVDALTFFPEGRLAGRVGAGIRVWDARTGELTRSLDGKATGASPVLAPDGSFLAAARGSSVRVLDLATGDARGPEAHSDSLRSLVFSAKGDVVLSGSSDGSVKLWRATDGALLWTQKRSESTPSRALGFADEGRSVVATFERGAVLDAATGREVRAFRGFDAGFRWDERSVAVSPDGTLLAARRERGGDSIRIFETASGKQLRELERLEASAPAIDLAFVNRGQALVAVVASYVTVFDVATGDSRSQAALEKRELGVVAVSSDAQEVAYLGEGGSVFVRDAASGAVRRVLERAIGDLHVTCLAFSPGGQLLVSGHEDASVRVRDTASGVERLVLRGHSGAVTCLAFSPDGRRLASGSTDTTALIWDLGELLEPGRETAAAELVPGYEDVHSGEHYVYASGEGTVDDLVFDRRGDEIDFVRAGHVRQTVKIAGAPASAPAARSPAGHLVGREVLVISGRRFECEVREKGDGTKVWVAPKYPFVIRSTGPSGTVSLELKEIKPCHAR